MLSDFDGITNVMEGGSFPNAALAASGNEPRPLRCAMIFYFLIKILWFVSDLNLWVMV